MCWYDYERNDWYQWIACSSLRFYIMPLWRFCNIRWWLSTHSRRGLVCVGESLRPASIESSTTCFVVFDCLLWGTLLLDQRRTQTYFFRVSLPKNVILSSLSIFLTSPKFAITSSLLTSLYVLPPRPFPLSFDLRAPKLRAFSITMSIASWQHISHVFVTLIYPSVSL